jgi:hypothetical protein
MMRAFPSRDMGLGFSPPVYWQPRSESWVHRPRGGHLKGLEDQALRQISSHGAWALAAGVLAAAV